MRAGPGNELRADRDPVLGHARRVVVRAHGVDRVAVDFAALHVDRADVLAEERLRVGRREERAARERRRGRRCRPPDRACSSHPSRGGGACSPCARSTPRRRPAVVATGRDRDGETRDEREQAGTERLRHGVRGYWRAACAEQSAAQVAAPPMATCAARRTDSLTAVVPPYRKPPAMPDGLRRQIRLRLRRQRRRVGEQHRPREARDVRAAGQRIGEVGARCEPHGAGGREEPRRDLCARVVAIGADDRLSGRVRGRSGPPTETSVPPAGRVLMYDDVIGDRRRSSRKQDGTLAPAPPRRPR